MINILIRSQPSRLFELKKCIHSVASQIYKDVHLIVSVEDNDDKILDIIGRTGLSFEILQVTNTGVPYNWNLYCNYLKEEVKNGWFLYIDSDDYLIDKFCLSQIAPHLSEDHATICQYKRRSISKPKLKPGPVKPEEIIQGRIGGSSIILHHSHKNVANWDNQKAADYRFIRDVAAKLPMVFVPIVVVKTGNRGRFGK